MNFSDDERDEEYQACCDKLERAIDSERTNEILQRRNDESKSSSSQPTWNMEMEQMLLAHLREEEREKTKRYIDSQDPNPIGTVRINLGTPKKQTDGSVTWTTDEDTSEETESPSALIKLGTVAMRI